MAEQKCIELKVKCLEHFNVAFVKFFGEFKEIVKDVEEGDTLVIECTEINV